MLADKIHHTISAYSGKSTVQVPSERHYLKMPQDISEAEEREMRNVERRLWIPASLNFPAGALGIPYDMVSSTHEEWHPQETDGRYWRDLSWPLIGTVFWWSAGKSLEGLIQARRGIGLTLSWIHPIIGIWELVTGGFLYALGVAFSTSVQANPPPDVVATGGLLWVLLGLMTLAAFWLQRRIPRVSIPQ